MTHLTHFDIISIVAAVVSVAVAITSLLSAIKTKSAIVHYSDLTHRAELDMTRKRFEDEIYRLNDRLTSTDQRWRDVNHLVISGQRSGKDLGSGKTAEEVPPLPFLKRAGLIDADYSVDRRLVFVLIPFHPDFDPLYRRLQTICQDLGLTCVRGDEEHVTGDLLSHILRLIVRARLVVAVVDGRNPNVFYELGIAHALSKPVLTLAKSIVDVPFDIRTNRIIFYSELDQLKQLMASELTKLLIADG